MIARWHKVRKSIGSKAGSRARVRVKAAEMAASELSGSRVLQSIFCASLIAVRPHHASCSVLSPLVRVTPRNPMGTHQRHSNEVTGRWCCVALRCVARTVVIGSPSTLAVSQTQFRVSVHSIGMRGKVKNNNT